MAPSFVTCSPPIWEDGRFSACVQQKYVANFIPFLSIFISAAFLLLACFYRRRGKHLQREGFEPLASFEPPNDQLPASPIARPLTAARGRWLTRLEGLLLATNIFSLLPFVLNIEPSLEWIPLGLFCSSFYVLLLWIGREWVSPGQLEPRMLNRIRVHLGILYTLYWLCMFNIVLSTLTGAPVRLWSLSSLLQVFLFTLFTLILLLHITAPGISEEQGFPSSTNESSASLLSSWSFSWTGPVIWKAFQTSLDLTDLYPLSWKNQSSVAAWIFYTAAPTRFSLFWRLYHFAKYDLLCQGAWAILFSLTSFCPAILLRVILGYVDSPETMSRNNAWLCVGGLLVTGIITGISDCQCEWFGRQVSVRLRAILINEIFGKVLMRRVTRPSEKREGESEAENSHATDGNILNLMTVDTTSICEVSAHMHLVWINFPFQLTIASMLLYVILGISGLLGVLVMIALLPLNILVSKRQVAAQMKVLSAGDARIQATNELIMNIRTIKLCTWEEEFQRKVRHLRKIELSELSGRFFWWSISMTVFYSLPFITTIVTLFLYTIVEKNSLESKVAFPALAIFAILRIPLDRMSAMISFMLQAHVSVGRIEQFLDEKETGRYSLLVGTESSPIGFENATFEWSATGEGDIETRGDIQSETAPSTLPFQLSNLQIHFRKNGLNAIFGPSGCGKSSLLLALLGEMELLQGRVHLPLRQHQDPFSNSSEESGSSDLAYCPQAPWIMNQTVRANILFGLPFENERYNQVLDAVSLTRDLTNFEKGDLMVAGERGNRLSGGQKQRVALARALYSKARFLILDDCLSALDSRTGKHIFFHAIKGPLVEGRTCILATHHSQLVLPHCDYAVLLENGRIKGQGTASDLVKGGLMTANLQPLQTQDLVQKFDLLYTQENATAQIPDSQKDSPDPEIASECEGGTSDLSAEPEYNEEKSNGAVSLSVIKTYLTSMGSFWFWMSVILGFAIQQGTSLGTNLWIMRWAHEFDNSDQSAKSGHELNSVDSSYYLAIYGFICLSYVLTSFVRDITAFSGALKASARIFDNLLDSILHARLIFFDKVPFGQITNRFSRDISAIDQEVSVHSMSTFYTFCSLATILTLISVILPMFLPVAALICLVYCVITKVYINSARDLRRLESVQQSPLYQHFGEMLSGYVSVRAYGHVGRLTEENRRLIDGFNQPYVLLWAAKQWLTVRVACLSAFISWLTGTFLLWQLHKGTVNPGVAGLVLTYAATFTENVLWLVQLYSIVQQSFISVDRVIEYKEIPSEPSDPLEPTFHNLPDEWPTHGAVHFRGYTTRYAPELNPVLIDINFNIPAGERVAVVGRTGAGKSTLTLALIRALEADSGSISIDGISIASVSLARLRKVVTVVPQEPTLFHGSLRDNLDPLHEHSDVDLERLLEELQFFRSLPSGMLDHPAEALSLGQRQLICIARALLRKSRVLILDEATASIDHATDALIQAGLRSSIAKGTSILTIAHRILSIADYDRVIVMDTGRVVEQGSVADLLRRRGENAFFRHLCEQSGDLAHIERAAQVEES